MGLRDNLSVSAKSIIQQHTKHACFLMWDYKIWPEFFSSFLTFWHRLRHSEIFQEIEFHNNTFWSKNTWHDIIIWAVCIWLDAATLSESTIVKTEERKHSLSPTTHTSITAHKYSKHNNNAVSDTVEGGEQLRFVWLSHKKVSLDLNQESRD